jgi:hypothetical protein
MRALNWQSALEAELIAARKRKWQWGEHDCTALAARCAQAVTGEPYFARFKAAFVYDTEEGAVTALAHEDLLTQVESVLDKAIPWVRCGHGDLVLCSHEDPSGLFTQLMTVHDGAQLLAAKAVGIAHVSFERALCGWKL